MCPFGGSVLNRPQRSASLTTASRRMTSPTVAAKRGTWLAGALALAVLITVGLGMSQTAADTDLDRVVLTIDFTDFRGGSVQDWLRTKGFVLERDARHDDRVGLEVDERGLIVTAKRRAFGFLVNERANVPVFSEVEIEWGVIRYPEGASYEKRINNEAIMVHVFLGDEKVESGSLLIPDAPYFIGLFLCRDDRVHHPYVGRYFRKGGRYVCLGGPEPGEIVTTRYALLDAYREFFDIDWQHDPGISGLAVEVDTTSSGDGGRSAAFIRRIRFLR